MKITKNIIGKLVMGCVLASYLTSKLNAQMPPGITNNGSGGTNVFDPFGGFNPTPTITYPTNATLLWELPLNSYCFTPPAVGPDGTIYVEQNNFPTDNNLWAINPDSSVKWQISTAAPVPTAPSCISLDVNGILYAPSFNNVWAYNSTNGSINWCCTNNGTVCPAIGTDGTIYASASKLYAITNGVVKWMSATNGAFSKSFSAVGSDGTIYVNTDGSGGETRLYAFNSDGSFKWRTQYQNLGNAYPPAIGPDGTIYFGAGNYFHAVNSTNGVFKWVFSNAPNNEVFEQVAEVGPDGTIYVEAYGNTNRLYAFNSNGSIKWTFDMSPQQGGRNLLFKGSACALASDGQIYVSDVNGVVYSLAPDGTTNWTDQTGSTGLLAPVIGPDGTVYINSFNDAHLYAFAGTSPVACSSWPQIRRNARGSGAVSTASVNSPLMTTNGFRFSIIGNTNFPVCTCASSDLKTWTNIGQTILTGGSTNFVDIGSTNYPYRFYKAMPQ